MSRKLLIKPFHSIESTATASHNWDGARQVLRAGASTIALALLGPKLAYASSVLGVRGVACARLHPGHDRIRSAAAKHPATAAGSGPCSWST